MKRIQHVFVSGKYAYATSSQEDFLAIVDVSNPSNPVFVAKLVDATNLNGANGVYVSGKYAYVPSAFSDTLAIIDISNPTNPVLAGSLVDGNKPQYSN